MKILITNDDSISSEVLLPLAKWAKQFGEVTVVVPKYEQSGKSHCIEIRKAFEVKQVPFDDPDIKAFEKVARKYGVDYAIKRVKGEPNKYLIFFKGRDEDAITAAMTEYADKRLRREERPSVLKLLKKLKELVASRDPVKNKEKERSR